MYIGPDHSRSHFFILFSPRNPLFLRQEPAASILLASSLFKMSNTSVPFYQCTLSTCPISEAEVHYVPTLFGNGFYIAIFVLLLGVQVFQGIYFRTWTFMSAMIGGLVLEIIGYGSRIQMHYNPFLFNPFLMYFPLSKPPDEIAHINSYLICLTIGPTFLSAAIYLCLARIIVVYGEQHSRFPAPHLHPRLHHLRLHFPHPASCRRRDR